MQSERDLRVELPRQHQVFGATLKQSSSVKHAGPRNLTGLYLGTEGQRNRPGHQQVLIPPLARGRGMPSSRVRTPTEEKRYKMVELMRLKGDKRGFSGQPVKIRNRPGTTSYSDPNMSYTNSFHNLNANNYVYKRSKDNLPVENMRNYTAANNSTAPNQRAAVYYEYLRSSDYGQNGGGLYGDGVPEETVIQEVNRLATETDLVGLRECFQKVCLGNRESIHHLLPQKKPSRTKEQQTGFTVKSYRTPKSADILADFTPAEVRPNTTPAFSNRLLVPSPYFKHSYTRSLANRSNTFHNTETDLLPNGRLATAPCVIGSNNRSKQYNSPRGSNLEINTVGLSPHFPNQEQLSNKEGLIPRDITTGSSVTITAAEEGDISQQAAGSTEKTIDKSADDTKSSKDLEQTADKTNITVKDDTKSSNDLEEAADNTKEDKPETVEIPNDAQNTAETADTSLTMDDKENTNPANFAEEADVQLPNGSEIEIEVQDEEGKDTSLIIDVQDDDKEATVSSDRYKLQRTQSITERLMKQKSCESLVGTMKEEAEARGRELEQLLDEHAEIIQEIDRFSVDSPDNTATPVEGAA